ncbi:amino acid adenylation domain-containing protein [Kitasatospora sp. NPDC001119]
MADRTLDDWFADSVRAHGDEPALEVPGERLSYRQLDALAQTMAERVLREHGRHPSRIGLYGTRTLAACAGYLAVQRLGATVVPLNPAFPWGRNEQITRTAALDLVLSENPLPNCPVPVVEMTPAVPATLQTQPLPQLERIVRAEDRPAYILFTSGSTGTPKGVPIRHGNVSAHLCHVIPRYGLGPGSRVSHTFDLTFDLSVFDLFATWGSGATLVVPSRTDLMNPARFVAQSRITHWFSVPSAISTAQQLGRLQPRSMPDLRWSLFCGEPLTLDQARAWQAAAPNGVLENLYGPTELTLSCAQYRLPADPDRWPRPSNGTVPIGELYPGAEEVVIDERGRVGAVGELCVRGAQRFDGYLDPADNQGRFLACDGGSAVIWRGRGAPGRQLWYRTGDLVRRADDVSLVHLGRLDQQVKVQGYRVEPGEIESVLREQPGVQQAVVVAVARPGGATVLHAVVTGDRGAEAGLLDALRERLPAHMVPRTVARRSRLPLTPNGKIDRRAVAVEQLALND